MFNYAFRYLLIVFDIETLTNQRFRSFFFRLICFCHPYERRSFFFKKKSQSHCYSPGGHFQPSQHPRSFRGRKIVRGCGSGDLSQPPRNKNSGTRRLAFYKVIYFDAQYSKEVLVAFFEQCVGDILKQCIGSFLERLNRHAFNLQPNLTTFCHV